jgi:hypothetical protein
MIKFYSRRATEDSILAVQVFDQKKFKKKDQGFLGVINVRIGDFVDFASGEDGMLRVHNYNISIMANPNRRDADARSQKVQR